MSVRYPPTGPPRLIEEGVRHARTRLAQRMDEALAEGGNLAEMAHLLGITPSVLRKHVRERVATGRWKFEATAAARQMWRGKERLMPTAGRLRRV